MLRFNGIIVMLVLGFRTSFHWRGGYLEIRVMFIFLGIKLKSGNRYIMSQETGISLVKEIIQGEYWPKHQRYKYLRLRISNNAHLNKLHQNILNKVVKLWILFLLPIRIILFYISLPQSNLSFITASIKCIYIQ